MKKLRGLLIILSLICLLSLGACSLTGGKFIAQKDYKITVNINYEFVNYTKNPDGTYKIDDEDYLLREDGSADIRYFITQSQRNDLIRYFNSVANNSNEILKQLENKKLVLGQDNVVLSQSEQKQAMEFFKQRKAAYSNLSYNLNTYQVIYADSQISVTQESEYPSNALKLLDVSYDSVGSINKFDITGKIGDVVLPVYESLFKDGSPVYNKDKQFITNNVEYSRIYKLVCEDDGNTFTNFALKSDLTFGKYNDVYNADYDDRYFSGKALTNEFIFDNGSTQVVKLAPEGTEAGSVATNYQSYSEPVLGEDYITFNGLYQYELNSTKETLDYASLAPTDPFNELRKLQLNRDNKNIFSYEFDKINPATNKKEPGKDSGKTYFEFTGYNGDLLLLDAQYTSYADASTFKFNDNLVQFGLYSLTYKRAGEVNRQKFIETPDVIDGNFSFGLEILKSNLDIQLLYRMSIIDKYYGFMLDNEGDNGNVVVSYLKDGTKDEIVNSDNGIIQQGVRLSDCVVVDITPNSGYAIDTIYAYSYGDALEIYKDDALLGKEFSTLTDAQKTKYQYFKDFCLADNCSETSIYRGSGMNYGIRTVTEGGKKFTRLYFDVSNDTPRISVTYKSAQIEKGTLTINYSGADVDTPAKVTQTYDIGSNYSVSSPVINGYNIDIPTVSGTMDRETVEVNVKYTPKTYKLTINHEYSTGGVAKTSEEKDVVYRQAYNFAIEGLTGYTSSVANVTGTLTTPENISVTVIYTVKTYTITVNYSGVSGLTSKSVTVEHGKSYSIESPIVAGYTPSQAIVSGSNVTAGATFTVTYTKNPTPTLANANFDGTTSNALNVTAAGSSLHFTSAINTSIFYYETSIKLNNVIGTDQWPKFGLVLENTSGDQIFFCIDAINGGNGIAYGSNKWILAGYKQSGASDFNFGLEKAEMKNLNYSFGSTIKMAVLKNGTRLVLLVNDIPTLEITRYTSFANNVKIGYLGFNFNVSISNAKCTTDTTTVNYVASEKKLVHDVVVDGDISDWTAEQKANPYSCYATDNSGKGFTVYAFMGTSGIHVFYEIKHSSWVNTQADWWLNTNVEMRAGVVGGGQSNLHIFATIIPGVTQNVLATAIKSSEDSSTGLRTTTVELVISYGLAGFTGTESSVNVGFACKTAGESAPGMTEGNAGDWWCGPRHCENSLSKVLKEGGITAQ